ncbi:MAG: kelch repeat-containing protein [Acidobacteriota bacterium]
MSIRVLRSSFAFPWFLCALFLMPVGTGAARAGEKVEPPARFNSTLFTFDGRVFLTSGEGRTSASRGGPMIPDFLNDLWEFSPKRDEWGELIKESDLPETHFGHTREIRNGQAIVFEPGFQSDDSIENLLYLSVNDLCFVRQEKSEHPDKVSGTTLVDGPDKALIGSGVPGLSMPAISSARFVDDETLTYGPPIPLVRGLVNGLGAYSSAFDLYLLLLGFDDTFAFNSLIQAVADDADSNGLTGVSSAPLPSGPEFPETRAFMAFAQRGSRLVIYGGQRFSILGDVWEIDVDRLAEDVQGGGPVGADAFRKLGELPPRAAASMVFLDDDTLLIFGGFNAEGELLQDTRVISLSGFVPFFEDDFETGDTDRWSSVQP